LVEEAHAFLKEFILSRRFAPGQRLSVDELAARLGISRTPVKDALTRLSAEGLVDIVPRRGTFVSQLTTQDVDEIFDVRELLELYAAKRVLLSGDASVLCTDLAGYIRAMDLAIAGDKYVAYDAFMAHDRDFHLSILRASRNRRLVAMYEALNVHIHIARAHYLRQVLGGIQANREHRQILDAFEQRSWPQVERALSTHIQNVKTAILANAQALGGSI
jgi:DNA-binding GntR family transcriptional regulator